MLPLLALAFTLSACATHIETTRPAESCASLVPNEWTAGVAGAPLPGGGAVVSDWIAFADEQTANLDVANSRYGQAMTIVSKCEARDRALVESLQHKSIWPF